MLFVKNDDMVEAFTTDRADQAFHERGWPRGPPALLIIASGPLPDARTNEPCQVQLEYHGSCGPRRFSATGLSAGLSINTQTGVIGGSPHIAGHYVINVEVCDQILPPDGQCALGEVLLRIWPSNGDCVHAIPAVEGLYYFGNIGATIDGPDEPHACDFSGYTHVESDVWYRYTSSCQGIAIVDACETGQDIKLAVYAGGACPAESAAWVCDDDGCPELGSWLGFPVGEGEQYLLRVGGYYGQQGRGEMLITCFNDCNINEQSDTEAILSGAAADCNGNLRPDECDLRSDASANGVLVLHDWPLWYHCLAAHCATPSCTPAQYPQQCCGWIDFDGDGDVELHHAAAFRAAFGSGQ